MLNIYISMNTTQQTQTDKQTLTKKISIRTVAKKVFKKNFVRSISKDGYVTLVGIRGNATSQQLEELDEKGIKFGRIMEPFMGSKYITWISFYTEKVIN